MTIKTVETENEGLKRAFMLTIPAEDIEARVNAEVKRIAPQVRMPGFRPGKVPPNLIKKMHGDAIQRDALQGAVQDGVQQLLEQQKVRPALQPEVVLDERYEPGKDAEIRVSLEALPDVPAPNIGDLALERLTVDADEAAVDAQLNQLAGQAKNWVDTKKGHKAESGNLVTIDFAGSVDGVPFEGGTGEDMAVELGSGQLIPGFEDQLVGAKAGEKRELNVTFPADYPSDDLKGKAATFAVTVKDVKTLGQTTVDEEFAKALGLEGLEQLKGLVRDQQQQELNGLTRTHMKRQLLDELAARHDFAVPVSMVEAEFQNIMNQLRQEASQEPDPKAALEEIESEAADYRRIAERRVRLGLLLSEIGSANGVQVSDQEMRNVVAQAASQYQGQDRERFLQLVQQEPMFAAQLRAPLYEDKVVDFLFSTAEVSERKATRAELEADLESEERHVHGPGCGHDHGAAAKPKKGAKKPAAKKADIVEKDVAPKPAKPKKSEPANQAAAKAVEAKPAAKKPAAKKPETKPAAKKPAATKSGKKG